MRTVLVIYMMLFVVALPGEMSTGTDSLKIGDYPVEGVNYEYYQYNK